MATAMMRALAAHDKRPELRGADTVAGLFLSEDRLAPLKDPGVHTWVMKNKIAPGIGTSALARQLSGHRIEAVSAPPCGQAPAVSRVQEVISL